MSTPPNDDPLPDDLDDLGGTDPSPGDAASDPESARREAEEALSEIEALADLDEDLGEGSAGGQPTADRAAETATGPSAEASGSAQEDAPEDQCANCGALLHGPYCSECGQKAADRIVPVWHMINEALEAVFELDLRVLRTLPTFLFLPGRLTKEYLTGRRTRYIRPFRLYLFSTFVLFAVVAFTTTGGFGLVLDPQGAVRLNPPDTGVSLGRAPDTVNSVSASTVFGDPEERQRVAKELASDSSAITVELFSDPATNRRAERVLRTKVAEAVRNPRDFIGRLIDQGPYLMFLMLPVFALLLKLLYVRRGRLYVEHLVFSLHVHALAFCAFTVGILLDQSEVGWLQTTATWVSASPFLYLVLAMRHVYEQGLFKSTLKASILLLVYAILLSIGFVVLLLLAILLM
ncbi:MAG: DUF3667 domain-containing protein [Salinibacter sp.]